MSVENDFLPFAVGAGANVLSQAEYAAMTALGTGFQAGTALSAALNKVWRQSSIISAVLAQFIVAQSGQPAIDDGTTATLLANLQAALQATVQGKLGNRQAFASFGVNENLTLAQLGQTLQYFGPPGGVWTLPSASSIPSGEEYEIINGSGNPLSITVAGGTDKIVAGPGTALTTLVLQQGDTVRLVGSGGVDVFATGGSGTLQYAKTLGLLAPQFDSSQMLATMAALQRALGNRQAFSASNANLTLTLAQCGQTLQYFGGGAGTWALPSASSIPTGAEYEIVNGSGSPLTIAVAGGSDKIIAGPGTPLTSLTLQSGDTVRLIGSSGTSVYATGGSGALPFSALFGSSMAANGYKKDPSGAILQWGNVTVPGGGTAGVTFPIAFPVGCFQVVASPYVTPGSPASGWVGAGGVGATSFTMSSMSAANTTNPNSIIANWWAIGH
ncbi:gp53-like domain-containing protein [Burkholderia cepacia]|uniref:gp53-like domain-containing protein n=1 Tax=Burkholderia cepacia TaxID=292 RepID=UPI003D67D3D8